MRMENWNTGSRSPNHRAYSPPATAVKKADQTNTMSLDTKVGTPRDWALSSSSRIALRPIPNRERSIIHHTSSATTRAAAYR